MKLDSKSALSTVGPNNNDESQNVNLKNTTKTSSNPNNHSASEEKEQRISKPTCYNYSFSWKPQPPFDLA